MNKSALIVLILSLCCITAFGQVTVPNTFASGGSISAAEMNANFTALVNAVNDLKAQVAAKGTALPVGSVIATYVAPDALGNYMTGSTEWAFADGSVPADVAGSYVGLFPDMRGQFVRGVNANRADGNQDSDFAARTGGDLNKAGSFQSDAVRSHSHDSGTLSGTTNTDGAHDHTRSDWSSNSAATGGGPKPQYSSHDVGRATVSVGTSGAHSHSFNVTGGATSTTGGSETRPTNIAVYWYIKVR